MFCKLVSLSLTLFVLGFSCARAQLSAGATTGFIINYSNNNPYNWYQTTIVDTLPAEFTYLSCSGAACSNNSGEIVWNLGTVNAGQSGTVTFYVVVNSCATPSVVDQSSIDITTPFESLLTNSVTISIICPTNTSTNTPTKTFTSTPTSTCTPTSSHTPTLAFTFTPSGTATNTPTITDTPTVTSTSTPTSTATYTPTPSSTPTITNTPTLTPTSTPTNTNTITNTPSLTPTSTPSYTPTSSPTVTPTSTPSNTFTITDTFTVTNTPTFTPTHTQTYTSTNSPTMTPTLTPSNTFTVTDTPTVTNTFTLTPTSTLTYTFTSSPTMTSTYTPTNTATRTSTPTNTNTPTNTSTPTSTFTLTSTPTPTPNVRFGKTSSENNVHPLDNVTYTLLCANDNSYTMQGAVITDNLPPASQMAYVANSAINGGVYNPANNTLTWTISSLAPGASITETYTLQVEVQTGNLSVNNLVNGACVSFGGWETCTSDTVTVGGSYLINVGVYNGAGELVKTLSNFSFGTSISNLTLVNGALQKDDQKTLILYQGVTIATWDATNSSGQKVTNGTYFIKTNSTDALGMTTTVTQTVSVSLEDSILRITVYNETGEEMKRWNQADIAKLLGTEIVLPAGAYDVGTARISSSVLLLSTAGGNGAFLTITLGSGQAITWNGTADNGDYLSPGNYFMEFQSSQPHSRDQQVVLPIHIENNGVNGINGVLLAPNPVNLKQTTQAKFLINIASSQVTDVRIKIYTVAGELVQTLTGAPGGSGSVVWDLSGGTIASGAYIAVAELNSVNGVIGRKSLEVVVIH